MEESLNRIYQEVILDHNKNPRNFCALKDANRYAHGVNPVCGDDFYLFLKLKDDGTIEETSFIGKGCAISKASASMLTEAVKGKTKGQAIDLLKKFLSLVTGGKIGENDSAELGVLKLFEGVKQFPVRVKCATLIWRALEEALKHDKPQGNVTTE